MAAGLIKKSSAASGQRLRVHSRSMTASINTYATWMPFGPSSRAIDSASILCAALVGAKPAKFALPRKRRGVTAGDDCTAARLDHRRRQSAREIQQGHRVHLEV